MDNNCAAIFDLDGTLIDSNGIWAQIDIDFLNKRSISYTQEQFRPIGSMSYYEVAAYFAAEFGMTETPAEMIAEWNSMAIDAYSHQIRLKPYVKDYLLQLKAAGVPIALATASLPELYEPVLQNNGILSLFDAFATVNEVAHGKGSPDVYLLAAKRLQREPDCCIVFEDILKGMCGAKKAGMQVYAVYDAHTHQKEEDILKVADRLIKSFQELLD